MFYSPTAQRLCLERHIRAGNSVTYIPTTVLFFHHSETEAVEALERWFVTADMEAENKLYADVHGEGQVGQPPQDPPKYTPAAPQPPQQGSFGSQFQGYPPYGSPSTPATPYYAAPSGSGYGGGYGNTQPTLLMSRQLLQQQAIVVGGDEPQVATLVPAESYSGAIICSCFVFWCCNFIFGLIGYHLASEYDSVLFRRGR